MTFIPAIESGTIDQIKSFQEQKLVELMEYLSKYSRFYASHFQKNAIDYRSIKTLEDLTKVPPTTKQDIQENNNEFICVGREKILDYVTTSGTLGDPVTFPLTDKDLDRLAYNEYLSFLCADGSDADLYQLTTTMDRRFMAGLAYFLGARKLGAGIVRVGSGIPELQWDTIKRVNPNAIIAVPSFLLKLIEYAELHKIDYKSTSITKAICIGEPIRFADFSLNTLGKRIQEKWDIQLYSTYASTEMVTAFTECKAGMGGHQHPELIIVEFLDDHDQPVGESEPGEVTISTLGIEGMPLLRFKTGDICHHFTGPCSCGRNTLRLGPIIGRKNQMIKYKGTSLYPPALYDILDNIPEVLNYIVVVYTNAIGTDEILIKAGCIAPRQELEKEIKDHFRAKLRVAPMIQFDTFEEVNKNQFPTMSRKPVKFFDRREIL